MRPEAARIRPFDRGEVRRDSTIETRLCINIDHRAAPIIFLHHAVRLRALHLCDPEASVLSCTASAPKLTIYTHLTPTSTRTYICTMATPNASRMRVWKGSQTPGTASKTPSKSPTRRVLGDLTPNARTTPAKLKGVEYAKTQTAGRASPLKENIAFENMATAGAKLSPQAWSAVNPRKRTIHEVDGAVGREGADGRVVRRSINEHGAGRAMVYQHAASVQASQRRVRPPLLTIAAMHTDNPTAGLRTPRVNPKPLLHRRRLSRASTGFARHHSIQSLVLLAHRVRPRRVTAALPARLVFTSRNCRDRSCEKRTWSSLKRICFGQW